MLRESTYVERRDRDEERKEFHKNENGCLLGLTVTLMLLHPQNKYSAFSFLFTSTVLTIRLILFF